MDVSENKTGTLRSQEHGHQPCVVEPLMIEMTSTKNTVVDGGVSPTLTARMGTGGNQVNAVLSGYGSNNVDIAETLDASYYKGCGERNGAERTVVYGIGGSPACNQGDMAVCSMQAIGEYKESGVSSSLKQRDYKDGTDLVVNNYIVRRLTPLECERLQGFPDGWTDIGEWTDTKGKKHKDADSPRYKALGNSIALPFWEWMAKKMVDVLKKDGVEHPTMASLFDGIGGFPLVYSHAGCKPVWASEIEEFPIAVTKIRFPEGDKEWTQKYCQK